MDKTDDGYALRHNPLGIHSLDGADIVIGKTPRRSGASVLTEEQPPMAIALQAKQAYYDPVGDDSEPTAEIEDDTLEDSKSANWLSCKESKNPFERDGKHIYNNTNVQSVEGQLQDLGIANGEEHQKSRELSLGGIDLAGTGLSNLDSTNDFSIDFSAELGGMLSRKPTISARPMPPSESTPENLAGMRTSTGPSNNPLLVQRLKSIRKQLSTRESGWSGTADKGDYEDDVKRAEGLPDDVLKMIAFSPDSPWLETDQFDDDNTNDIGSYTPQDLRVDHTNTTLSVINGKVQPQPFMSGTPAELNPFYAARNHQAQEKFASLSPSVTTLSSTVSDGGDDTVYRSPSANGNSRTNSAEPENMQKRPQVEVPPSIEETDPVAEDDRGRLFLQINRFANMRGLPIDVTRSPKFTLSLDNGLQSVTTEPASLPSPGFNGLMSAKIGQEFELTVAKDLQLVLTIGVSMNALKPPARPLAPPRASRHEPQQSVSSASSAESTATASGSTSGSPIKSMKNLLLRSPRKKQQARFQERKVQDEERLRKLRKEEEEEEERSRIQHERDLREFHKRADIWRNITGKDGEYCRGYVLESHYEKDIYGKAQSFAIPLYNEWDKSTNGVPKPVCELQVTMMYVPKLYGSEKIPMSIQQCLKELETAKMKRRSGCEGFLTQQGGDCVSIWRRRYFTLNGNELIGHHEATKKRRSIIHLDKAVSVKDKLDDDLWCIYEDRSFQITFEDGEAIGFYADTVEARELWLKHLQDSIANSTGQHRSWKDLVLDFQDSQNRR